MDDAEVVNKGRYWRKINLANGEKKNYSSTIHYLSFRVLEVLEQSFFFVNIQYIFKRIFFFLLFQYQAREDVLHLSFYFVPLKILNWLFLLSLIHWQKILDEINFFIELKLILIFHDSLFRIITFRVWSCNKVVFFISKQFYRMGKLRFVSTHVSNSFELFSLQGFQYQLWTIAYFSTFCARSKLLLTKILLEMRLRIMVEAGHIKNYNLKEIRNLNFYTFSRSLKL